MTEDGEYVIGTGPDAVVATVTWHEDSDGVTAMIVTDTPGQIAVRAEGGDREDVVRWIQERTAREGVRITIGYA